MTVFNSRSPACRSPLGAVESGAEVRFTARPESWRFPLRGFLCVHAEALGENFEIPMENIGEDGGSTGFTAKFNTNSYIGLYYYSFRFENDGGSFFYGAKFGRTGGECSFYGGDRPTPFQLTVCEKDRGGEWFGAGVTYQIFPDRFARDAETERKIRENPEGLTLADGSTLQSRERVLHLETTETPAYTPEKFRGKLEVTNRDFFGGTFRGIAEKLEYLHGLGVETLYLNPIFEAFSNHRYDTADYLSTDPMLGSEADFRGFCDAAHVLGMRIILDGVFNHTGSDSIYFNKNGRYSSAGAYNSNNSPYVSWYEFTAWPDKYSAWWGIETLPQVRENEPSYREFITGENGVVRRWLAAGADGWRLDVADELPDDFIAEIRAAARAEKPDSVIIGEVWEDASSKISHSARRRYILGGGLDGVTGYPFRTALLRWLSGGDAEDFRAEMEDIFENYPSHAARNSMNILGTHDTPRILTALGISHDDPLVSAPKSVRAEHYLSGEQREHSVKLLKIASLLQYTFPGSPTLLYGDEAGLEGFEDPFNRRFYPWGRENAELLGWYRKLGALRKALKALRCGTFCFLIAEGATLAFERKIVPENLPQTESFPQTAPPATLTEPANISGAIPTNDGKAPLNFDAQEGTTLRIVANRDETPVKIPLGAAYALYRDLLNGEILPADAEGKVEISEQSVRVLGDI